MSITEQGIKAEKDARKWLNKKGFMEIQQLDWVVKDNTGDYFIVEVKHRELYMPPPFIGTGLDKKQMKRRMQIYDDTGIRTLLLVFTKEKTYYQWLHVLEKSEKIETKNGIIVYNINSFKIDTK